MRKRNLARLTLLYAVLHSSTGCAAPTSPQPRAADGSNFVRTNESPKLAQKNVSKGDRFYSDTVGFGIVKPTNWVFGTVEWEEANRRRMSVGNEELDELVRRHANAPLVVIIKYPEPSDKLNPAVKVALRPLGQLKELPPREIGAILVSGMKQSIPSFELEGEIRDVVVGGVSGAAFRSRFSVEQVEQGTTFQVLSRTWLVPRGAYLFVIGMSGPQAGEDVSESEFARILSSIEIRER